MTTYEILKNAQFLISKQKNHVCQIFLKFPQRKISLSDFKKCDGEISKTNLIRGVQNSSALPGKIKQKRDYDRLNRVNACIIT